MHGFCMRLPSMLMLELSAANWTCECRFFSTFHPDMTLQGTTPLITFPALKTEPHLLGCKKRSVSDYGQPSSLLFKISDRTRQIDSRSSHQFPFATPHYVLKKKKKTKTIQANTALTLLLLFTRNYIFFRFYQARFKIILSKSKLSTITLRQHALLLRSLVYFSTIYCIEIRLKCLSSTLLNLLNKLVYNFLEAQHS